MLAQWRIDVDLWREFALLDAQLLNEQGTRVNELRFPDAVPADGVEVVIGAASVNVGASVHTLPLRSTPEIQSAVLHDSRVRPSYIELLLKYPGGVVGASGVASGPLYTALRFPVARSALVEARGVVAHFNGDLPGTADFFHGRGDGTDAEDLSRCWTCGFETHKWRSECPRCGSNLQSRRWSRRFGLVTTISGTFVTAVLGAVLTAVWPMLRHPGVDVDGMRFSGTAAQSAFVLMVLCAVFALGATLMAYGIWQMRTGRRSRKVVSYILGIFGALILIAWLW